MPMTLVKTSTSYVEPMENIVKKKMSTTFAPTTTMIKTKEMGKATMDKGRSSQTHQPRDYASSCHYCGVEGHYKARCNTRYKVNLGMCV